MELVSTVRRPWFGRGSHTAADRISDPKQMCSISTRNTVAFTASGDVTVAEKSNQTLVCVADLNTPWEVHEVTACVGEITSLEWDGAATQLLVAESSGQISIWGMNEHLLNEWTLQRTFHSEAEDFIFAAWLHSGKVVCVTGDCHVNNSYADKFKHVTFSPSVKCFGGRAMQGFVTVCASGTVGVTLTTLDGETISGNQTLAANRHRVKLSDFSYTQDGSIMIVTSDGLGTSAINCFKITLTMQENDIVIHSQPLPTIYTQAYTHAELYSARICSLKFSLRECVSGSPNLVIGCNSSCGGVVEVWELRERQLPVNKVFKLRVQEHAKQMCWQRGGYVKSVTFISAIGTPYTAVSETTPNTTYVMVAYGDGSLHCLFRSCLSQVTSVHVNLRTVKGDKPKLPRLAPSTISDIRITWSTCGMLVLDQNSGMAYYSLSPVVDPGGIVTVPYAVTLLEYCICVGWDWWDVLICVRGSLLEAVCEELTEGFLKQSQPVQQFYYTRYMALKMSLFRSITGSQSKAGECNVLLMLNSVASAFKSLLRPSVLTSQDKSPAENLAAVVNNKETETDVDRILQLLEPREFTVDVTTLVTLQHLAQWVADLTLYLLSCVPHLQQSRGIGYGLIKDPRAVRTLRELLVMIRTWGLLAPSFLPVFTKTWASMEVLPLLFKLLTRLLQGSEQDETLLDECCLLSSQVMVPNIHLNIPPRGILSPQTFNGVCPYQFEYGVTPEYMQSTWEQSCPEGVIDCKAVRDCVRHVYMGSFPPEYKICTRCMGRSLIRVQTRSLAMKAWDQSWIRACACGGHWIKVP